MDKSDFSASALLVIDLQMGILGLPLAPHSADTVVAKSARLVSAWRAQARPVALTTVAWAKDFADALQQPVDRPLPMPPGGLPANWAELSPELSACSGDILITKRQWNAFHGTELDLQLRRRGVRQLVIAGVATNMGVESTARVAYELGYRVVFAEDAISSISAEMHAFATQTIFPLIGHVRSTADILDLAS